MTEARKEIDWLLRFMDQLDTWSAAVTLALWFQVYPKLLQETAQLAGPAAPDWVRILANASPAYLADAIKLATETLKIEVEDERNCDEL